jgi:hypothetical protein
MLGSKTICTTRDVTRYEFSFREIRMHP